MEVDTEINRSEKEGGKRIKTRYIVFIGASILLSVLLVVAIFYFWKEIQNLQGYGYLTSFLVSIMGGTLVIPISNMPVVFTLGNRLNPAFVGLAAGFGEAIGGITVYLTGAGGRLLGYKYLSRHVVQTQLSSGHSEEVSDKPEHQTRWQRLFKHLAVWIDRLGGSWAVFITSSFIWWLSYPVALAAGASGNGLKRFFLVSWAGKTIRGLIIAYAGYWGLHFFTKIPVISEWLIR